MAEKKKKKKKVVKRERKERRFEAQQTRSSTLSVVAGMVGALALGAGVYAQWIRDPALPYGQYMVAGGALVLGIALWFGDTSGEPIRVGDAGVATEKGSDLIRLAWCDMERIYIERGKLVLAGSELTLEIPLASHGKAAAWILKAAVERVPEAMDVKNSQADALPNPTDEDGEFVLIENVQVVGRHCAVSDKAISFERDARLCPVCAQVYHRLHVPKKCVTCGEDISSSAYAL